MSFSQLGVHGGSMIIALYIVAFAMIGGGLAALVQGLPYIMVERGWAMVIAGTVAASGGAVLAGVAVAAARLGRIHDELAGIRDRGFPAGGITEPSLAGAASDEMRVDGSPALPPAELGSRAAAIAPVAPPPARDIPGPEDAREGAKKPQDAGDAKVDVLDAAKQRTDMGEAPAAELRPEARRPPAMPSQRETPPAAEAPREPDLAPDEETTIIGTYSSGGNSYVMYSDGSIQADTPTGLYRFKSLDELKDFIAAGGEGEGAARA